LFHSTTNWRNYYASTDYLILDDLKLSELRQPKSLLGCQPIITVTDKYVQKLTLPWGKPLVWCMNRDQDPRREMDYEFREWFDANVMVYELENKLY